MLALMLLTASIFTGCGSGDSHKKSLTPVRVQSIVAQDVNSPVSFTATVNPYTQLNLDFKVFGYIREILQVEGADGRIRDIQEGDFVSKDLVLARVDEADYIAKVIEQKAQVDEAVKSDRLSRLQELLKSQQRATQNNMVGREVSVLFERPGRLTGQLVGKSGHLHAVHVTDERAKIGAIQMVRITRSEPNSLAGDLAI